MTVRSNKFVNAIAYPLLIPLIEKNEDCTEVLKKYLSQVRTNKIVLGCTHYPILTDKIKKLILI